ncbi:MAG TPA: PrsW family glutamic-type intramembrane protease [Sphingomicrobium sp.]|jgi:RsiW-degrading membrane proteinase PrsW (M82 family)|nr:PrsW family glutamic-type intramembrane protease [Sphingomicrobium sp.]
MSELLIQAAHWGLALVPVLVLLAVFVWLDAFKLMSFGEVLVLLVLGAIAAGLAWPVSGRLLDTLPIGFSNYSRFVAPWIEEAIKAAIMIGLFRINRIGYKLDAVISGFAIGAGFAVVENIIYLTIFPSYGAGTWLVRGVGTAVMHGTTLAILAAVAHEFAERETREAAGDFDFNLLWFVPGYLVAVALHIAFNQFPDRPLVAMMGAIIVAPLALIGIFYFGTAEAKRWLIAECAAHHVQLETLRSGKWPETPAGRKISALAERQGPEGAKRIRRYWELQAWLVSQAEEMMIEQESGEARIDQGEVRATFEELAGLKRALGRSTYSALNALLPFSRNDHWEVSELRQRLGHRH